MKASNGVKLILLMLMCGMGVAVQAQVEQAKNDTIGKQKVAVYVTGETENGVGDVFGNKLVDAITQNQKYVAIERTAEFLQHVSQSQHYEHSGAVDINQISEIGRQLHVELVCVAVIKNVLGSKYIQVRLINVKTAEIVKVADGHKDLKTFDDLISIANETATKLLGKSEQNHPSNLTKCKQCGANGVDLWVAVGDAGVFTYNGAVSACSSIGMRLPSQTELEKIMQQIKYSKIIETGRYYWSNSKNNIGNAAYIIWYDYNHMTGQFLFNTKWDNPSNLRYTRCVKRAE